MARPSELIEFVANALGVPVPTVREKARVLRNAGLINKEKGGRGPGAMSFRDATNLVIAVAGASIVCESHLPVQELGPLKTEDGPWKLEFAPISELTSLGAEHTLGAAIEALIRSASVGSFQKAAGIDSTDFYTGYRGNIWVEVTLFEPAPMASLAIGTRARDEEGIEVRKIFETKNYYITSIHENGQTTLVPPLLFQPKRDLHHEHKFSHETILHIASLFRS